MRRTAWGLADQGVVSLGNFCTTLLLIRSLPPQAFGSYALMLNAVLFLNNMQQSLIGYPLCVRGSQADAARYPKLITSAIVGTTGLLLPNVLVLLGVCIAMKQPALLLPLAVATLLWQLQDTLRSAFQSRLRQREAVPGDAVSYLGQAAVIALLCGLHHISVTRAWWVVGATSLSALLIQLRQLRPSLPRVATLVSMLRDHWTLGRWTIPARIMGFFTLQAFPWAIALHHGTGQVATFQALFQIIALANPVLLSMGSLMTASIAQSHARSPRSGSRYITLTALLTGTYLLLVGVAGPQILSLLYGAHGRYAAYGGILRMMALAWTFEVVALICTSVLGGMERTTGLLWVQGSGCVVAVAVALPLVSRYGLAAVAGGLLLVNVVRAICGIALVFYASSGRWKATQATAQSLISAEGRAA